MCGIVGYVGRTQDGTALDVVMEGLARLEYRGYDSAGVALIDGDHVETRKKSGKLANLTARDRGATRCRCRRPASATPAGRPTAARPTTTPTRTAAATDGKLALIHNGIIENFHALKNGLLADGVSFTSETDTEVVAHLSPRPTSSKGDLTEAMRTVVADLEGAFTLLAIHADQPGVVVGARRNSPLVVGPRRRRQLPRLGRRGLHRSHPSRPRARAGPDRHDHARRGDGHRLRRLERRGQGLRGDVGRRRRREGRLRDLHGEGDQRAAARRAPTRCSGAPTPDGRLVLDELRISEEQLRAVDRITIVACGTAAYAGMVGEVRHRALDAHPRRGRARP